MRKATEPPKPKQAMLTPQEFGRRKFEGQMKFEEKIRMARQHAENQRQVCLFPLAYL